MAATHPYPPVAVLVRGNGQLARVNACGSGLWVLGFGFWLKG